MSFVLGRDGGLDGGPAARLGTYRALDGSRGASLYLDVDGPHAGLVVGKRGYGKSYTLGVLAEALATTDGVAPVVVDPMGAFAGLEGAGTDDGDVPATVVSDPTVDPSTLGPRAWCSLLDLSPESGPGGLVWRAATLEDTLPAMVDRVETTDAPEHEVRAATNHLRLAASWGVFDVDGLSAADLGSSAVTVLDVSTLERPPTAAVVRSVGESVYRGRVDGAVDRLPWLLVDEAHAFADTVARPALERILTRGRAPGVSLVMATQRPSAVPDVAVSQSDLLVAHRLTAEPDIRALERVQPTYLDGSLGERLPTAPGEVTVVDDATETVHTARVRERTTPHRGGSAVASEVCPSGDP